MKFARNHRLPFLIVVAGAILAFAKCTILGIDAMALSIRGRGDAILLVASNYGNKAWQFLFLAIILVVVAILIRYRINKLEVRKIDQEV